MNMHSHAHANGHARSPDASPPDERPKFLARSDCQELARRLTRYAVGGGITTTTIFSTWTSSVRWARNMVHTANEISNNYIKLNRNISGAGNDWVLFNDIAEGALIAGDRRAERLAQFAPERYQSDLQSRWTQEPATDPTLFFEATYQADTALLATTAQHMARMATSNGVLSSGYIEVGAHSVALIDTLGHLRYCQYTTARVSTTVRDLQGTGSGWAGVDWPDWSRINAPSLMERALDKCLKSRHPVAIEPGRYTTILEPQAVCDCMAAMIAGENLDWYNDFGDGGPTTGPFGSVPRAWHAMLGKQVIDRRLTITSDPLDPDLGFPAFNLLRKEQWQTLTALDYETYHPVTWIEHGVLRALGYNRSFGQTHLHRDTGLPVQGAFRMTGGDTSIQEMIASTKRGLLVTRFDRVEEVDRPSLMMRGVTRDGVWLIEDNKISKPVKNFLFEESVVRILNSVDQLGPPQRVFRPWEPRSLVAQPSPVIVPPIKVRDFSFTSLCDAV